MKDPASRELTRGERQLQRLNDWIKWLEDYNAEAKPEGPSDHSRGIKNLTNFLRGLAYDWPFER